MATAKLKRKLSSRFLATPLRAHVPRRSRARLRQEVVPLLYPGATRLWPVCLLGSYRESNLGTSQGKFRNIKKPLYLVVRKWARWWSRACDRPHIQRSATSDPEQEPIDPGHLWARPDGRK